jgi:hypothetical protein
MKRFTTALPEGFLTGAARLGQNKARVAHGQKPLARGHLPFNRRRSSYGQREVDNIAEAARREGLDREQTFQLRRYLFDMRRRELAPKEEFMLHFNAAYDAAIEAIWAAHDRAELGVAPRTCIQVYTKICQSAPALSAETDITRAALAKHCRLSEREVSRHTAALVRLDLLRTDQDGRGVRYVVLPVGEHGYPLWHGDRIAMLDAASEARAALDRERQAELVV